jgi:hypothetical protein
MKVLKTILKILGYILIAAGSGAAGSEMVNLYMQ